MNSVNAKYHTLHALRSAQPKLREAITSNSDRDLVNCISECVLNVLNGNIALTVCDTRKIHKNNLSMRIHVDKQIPLSGKEMNNWLASRIPSTVTGSCSSHAR